MPNTEPFQASLIQMCSGRDEAANLRDVAELVRAAAKDGAQYIQTPEVTPLMERERTRLFANTHPEEANSALAAFRRLASELSVWLHVGSMGILLDNGMLANRSFLIAPDGIVANRYDKIHMFDVALPNGESYRESKRFAAGEHAVLATLPWAQLGMTICYDLRFPALYLGLAQAGAHFLAVPSAFTKTTGEAHWHCLLRARAIETGCYVLAAAQAGLHENGRETYGHSLIVSPWGNIIAERADGPGIVSARIDPAEVAAARNRIPSLTNARDYSVNGSAADVKAQT